MSLGKRLRALRLDKKYSQDELGNLVGSSQAAVTKWENDARSPDYDTLCWYADHFNVTTDWLLGRVHDRSSIKKELTVDGQLVEFRLVKDATGSDALDPDKFSPSEIADLRQILAQLQQSKTDSD